MSHTHKKDQNYNCDPSCDCSHDHTDGCDCGHDHHHRITLTMEDGKDVECEIIAIFNLKDYEYIALLPENEEDVFLYRFKELDNQEINISNIESEEEYDEVAEVFYNIFDDENFDDEDFEK